VWVSRSLKINKLHFNRLFITYRKMKWSIRLFLIYVTESGLYRTLMIIESLCRLNSTIEMQQYTTTSSKHEYDVSCGNLLLTSLSTALV
jgi:hypothetical protein